MSSQAQEYIRQGYLIKNDGDTLKGFIRDMEWDQNPEFVTFQAERGGSSEKYTIDLIKGFYTSRPVYYERYMVMYDPDKMQEGEYPTTREPNHWMEATVFLQRIVNGGTSLFLFNVNGRAHFFIKAQDGAPEELLNRTYKDTNPEGVTNLRKAEKWKQQLINYSMNCPSLRARILDLQYERGRLAHITESINQCNGQTIIPLATGAKPKKKKALLGVFGQAFIPHVTTIYNYAPPLNKVVFAGGISYEFFSRTRPNRISVYSELKSEKINYQTKDEFGTSLNLDMQSYFMVNMIRFSYPVKASRIFWNVGIVNGYRSQLTITPVGVSYYSHTMDDTGMVTGLAAGAGMGFLNSKKIKTSLEVRYELHNSLGSASVFLGTSILGLFLGIQF